MLSVYSTDLPRMHPQTQQEGHLHWGVSKAQGTPGSWTGTAKGTDHLGEYGDVSDGIWGSLGFCPRT